MVTWAPGVALNRRMQEQTTNKFALADNDWYRNTLTDLLNLLASGALKPVVAERIPLAEAARAHETIERSAHTGKIVLVTDETPVTPTT